MEPPELATKAAFAAVSLAVVIALILSWKVLNWVWLRPKKLEKILREQGLQGNPYRILVGDVNDFRKIQMEAKSKPMNLSDDIVPRVQPYVQQSLNKYGKNSFIWFGPRPRVIITDPELIKDVMNRINEFQKPTIINPLVLLLASGLLNYEGEKWSKHRKIVNPAFKSEKLKIMMPLFYESSNYMIRKWEEMLSPDGSCEIDVWPFLQNLTGDVISRTLFGSNYEEGKRIFELQKELGELAIKVMMKVYIPGSWFLPTPTTMRMKEIARDMKALLKVIINKREKSLEAGEPTENDLLGILLESNHKEIQDHGNNKNVGMTLQEVIEECKLFYFAGQESTSTLLVWTMVLLSRYPEWQECAREEVLQVFGNKKPNFDGLSHLKIISMILYEVLRLYPPGVMLSRAAHKDVKLGNLIIPSGVQVSLPIVLVHHNHELWGDDADEFKPERFSEGILKATNGRTSYFPFGWGPRICIGQNFALLEAKMALSLILQHFSFELSPSYAHAPISMITLQPQYGVHIILHKVQIEKYVV